MHEEQIHDIHNSAREIIENIVGCTPENYKFLLFADQKLYESIILQTRQAGSPRAVISSNELDILNQLKEANYSPTGIDLTYPSRDPRIFMPESRIISKPDVLKAKFIHALAKAVLIENTKSNYPRVVKQLYRHDAIIADLFSNNVFEFARERNAPWVWQYFQDFTASIRLLGLYNLDDFYVPPNTIRDTSIFYNYLLEIKEINKQRSKDVTKASLFDLILNGFAELVLEDYLSLFDVDRKNAIIPYLKGNLGSPLGVIGKRFLLEHGEGIEAIFNEAIKLESDYDLVRVWSRNETKKELDLVRENLNHRATVWHAARDLYWPDLWPIRASAFDKLASSYVGRIQRRKYRKQSELLNDTPLVSSHGSVQLRDREVAVFAIQEDTISQQQLLILRNHLQAKKDSFTTPLPGLPDVIVFKKFSGMHVASYLGVADKTGDRRYPSSPYDLPLVVRAVQVTKRKDAYISEEREEDSKLDSVNYDNLQRLSEPQYRAIRYLIRQGEVQ